MEGEDSSLCKGFFSVFPDAGESPKGRGKKSFSCSLATVSDHKNRLGPPTKIRFLEISSSFLSATGFLDLVLLSPNSDGESSWDRNAAFLPPLGTRPLHY